MAQMYTQAVSGSSPAAPPGFDPSQPFEYQAPVETAGVPKVAFDPTKPFDVQAGRPSLPPATPPDTSLSGAIGYGVDNTAHSLGSTADVLGLPTAASALQGVHTAPANYQPVSLTGDISNGRWASLPGDLVRKGAEMLPAVGGTALAAAGAVAAAPEAAATAVGLGAGALGSAALRYGDNVKASAANNGDAAPTAGDYVRGALVTAPQAAIDAVGLRVPGLGGMASSVLGKAAVRTGADAAAAGLSDQVGQIGTSIGTPAGLKDDPSQTAEAMLGTLPARAMTQAPSIARSGIKAGTDAAVSRTMAQPTDADHAAAIEGASQVLDDARASLPATVAPLTVANAAKTNLAQSLRGTFAALADNYPELIDQGDKATFAAVLNQARARNNAVGDSANPHVATLLDQVSALPLPPEAVAPLVNGLRSLDVLSDPAFASQRVAPFQAAGRVGGQLVAGIGGLLHDPTHGLATLAVAGLGGRQLASGVGGSVGAGLDRVLGTNTPAAMLQRAAAQRMLNRTGTPLPSNPVADLQTVQAAATDRPSYAPAPVTDIAAANRAASAAYAAAQERDAAAVQRAQVQRDTLKQQQIDAAYTQNAAPPPPAPTADPDYSAALGQVGLPADQDPTAAYMAGKAVPGMDGTTPAGAQTAAEIAGWAQMQRNRAAALAAAQRAQGVLQQAVQSDPAIAGQNAIDAAARRNAVTLATGDVMPSDSLNVNPVASDAAVSQAMARAARVMRAAGVTPPDALGNLPDPVPINVPLRADGSVKGGPRAPKASTVLPAPSQAPAASVAAPTLSTMPTPDAAPVQAQGAPATPPWMRYVQHADPGITPDHVDQAIDAQVASGAMTPQYAAAMRNHSGVVPADVLAPIQAEAARLAVVDRGSVGLPPSANDGSSFGPAPEDTTVRRHAAYLYATQGYHQLAVQLGDAAQSAGGSGAKAAVAAVAGTRGVGAKRALRSVLLKANPALAHYLPDALVNHGPP